MALYELAVLGAPTAEQLQALEKRLSAAADSFKLKVGQDITLAIKPTTFTPGAQNAAAAVFFGGAASAEINVGATLRTNLIPVLPVPSTRTTMNVEIPTALRGLNCLFYDSDGPDRVFSTMLSCVGLLRPQRRIFLSYKRSESTTVAMQLFAELSARNFTVFLDTHSVPAAVDFQEEIWHQLVDVDVMLMLDTPSYFTSRWTQREYGRALAKGLSVLRVQWPGTAPNASTANAAVLFLAQNDLNPDDTLVDTVVQALCTLLEQNRSLAYATRLQSAITEVEDAIAKIEGHIDGVGPHQVMHVRLRNGRQLVVQPTIGVPSAVTLHETVIRAAGSEAVLVYDHVGLKPSWQTHIHWLAENFKGARWIKVTEAAWEFAGLEE